MNDYDRIAEAIRLLEAHRGEEPDLSTLAARIELSPSAFHQLFSAWAGSTPRDLLHCLTLSHARELLRNGESLLAAARDSGLSGPGRLHDPCISLDAATPDEIKSRGASLVVRAGVASSPFGQCLVGETPRGICHLSFFDGGGRERAAAELSADWPMAEVTWDDARAASLVAEIFPPSPARNPSSPWRLFVRGTPFQIRVWRALLEVPAGSLISYGKLASACGNPKASRATGTAVGRNAISFLIPCHRVIRETGASGHYRWGSVRKRAILAWESSRISQ